MATIVRILVVSLVVASIAGPAAARSNSGNSNAAVKTAQTDRAIAQNVRS